MKKLFACAAALGLMASLPASAQHNDHRDGKNDGATANTEHHGPPPRADRNDRENARGPAHAEPHATTQTGNQGNAAVQQYAPKAAIHQSRPDNRYLPASGDVHPSNVGRPNINSLRRNMQASKHFRSIRYAAPQGYQSRRWTYGERLPRGYYARSYWIANLGMLDLFSPPPGLVWVRVGNDALLIDQMSGDIVQVRYGVFY